ncbi:MAG: homoserine dehydrogenase [Candidatus Bathyarchaeia archaeon]
MRIILVGFGVVGQSFLRILLHRKEDLVKNYGFHPRIVAVVDSRGAATNQKGLNLEEILSLKAKKGTVAACREYGHFGMSALDVIEAMEAEVVVEATPTNIKNGEPGLSNIKAAFKAGKHVVTTNKGPLALALPALIELASYNKVHLRFSGTVGGGTPILEFAKKCLLGDRIISIKGILNGTTNYILTEMEEKRVSLQQALKNAQELGYAEADSSMDIDGLDTACKLVIMANWIMQKEATLKDVNIQGIRDITLQDIEEASKRGFSIKLIGSINGKLEVKPTKIDKRDPLSIGGVFNAVTFVSETAGKETIVGRGAGGMETATAILRDLLDIKQNLVRF